MKEFEVIWECTSYMKMFVSCPVCKNSGHQNEDFEFCGGGYYKCKRCYSLLKINHENYPVD